MFKSLGKNLEITEPKHLNIQVVLTIVNNGDMEVFTQHQVIKSEVVRKLSDLV